MNIDVRGLDELKARFDGLAKGMSGALEDAAGEAVLHVHSQVPPYPAPPPNSTYRRTGTLGRSITTDVRALGSKHVGVIGTATVYAPWVISEKRVGTRGPQAGMHAGRWWTLHGVVRGAHDEIMRIYRKAIASLFGFGG